MQKKFTGYIAGQTPLDLNEIEGLIPDHITLLSELNELEQVNITKSLHLIGAGVGSSVIAAPATLPASGNATSSIILIGGSGVGAELTGFTVAGPGPSGCGSIRTPEPRNSWSDSLPGRTVFRSTTDVFRRLNFSES